ncbi:hypothetical protein L6452_17702 [Arctium lappa]|uniref:Uncharacterized protein n=1 Tax=Arctium lappa TaxID=4217 RepID=A0ACB9C4A3_ARCLA|nr:hypothetical protein L6452_17702 [Arctium lappa]
MCLDLRHSGECHGSSPRMCRAFWMSLVVVGIKIVMVNTRSRLPSTSERRVEVESTADQPHVVDTSVVPPKPNLLGGGPEKIPRTNIATNNAFMEEVTMETRIRDNMMLAMNSAMAQQQEFFMKLLEDQDASHRQPETMAENVVMGSGGGPTVVVIEDQTDNGSKGKARGCTYKAFPG